MRAKQLESSRLKLVPLSLEHLSEEYVSWMNDSEVNAYMESGGDYSIEKLEAFLKEQESKDIYFWAIHLKENGRHVGNIKIDPISEKHKRGEYGIMIGDKSVWGTGVGYEASELVLDFCFSEELSLNKITLGVVASNKGAVRLYEKLGFEREAHLKNHCCYGGEMHDVFLYGKFKR